MRLFGTETYPKQAAPVHAAKMFELGARVSHGQFTWAWHHSEPMCEFILVSL